MADQLLRRPEVERTTGLSRAAIYAMMARGDFPRPRRLGPNSVAWRRSDIDEWIEALPVAEGLGGETRATAG